MLQTTIPLPILKFNIIIKFVRYSLMSIKKGLRYGDDDDVPVNPQQYGTTDFKADRDRTNFDKDMDSLFEKPIVVRRKKESKAPQINQSNPVTTDNSKKPIIPANNYVNPNANVISNDRDQSKNTTTNKNRATQAQKKNQNKSTNNQSKQTATITIKQKDAQKETGIKQTQSKIVSSPNVQQPNNVKQYDVKETIADLDNLIYFNRPAYIRKLKKIAEDFNFNTENQQQHRFIEVVRPSECYKGIVKKLNAPEYSDHQFPPIHLSVGFNYRKDDFDWKMPSKIFKEPIFGKYIDPNDIQPGPLSSPQFLSTLSCLAERQENIKRLIENQNYNENGFYYIRLNINGVWRYISVDHYLPEQNGTLAVASSFNDSESDLWVSLIEKAYAKSYHSYQVFKQSVPRQHYLRDLTGAPIHKIFPSDAQFSIFLSEAIQNGWPIVAVPTSKATQIGLNPNYSWSVIRGGSRGFQFRSSFGTIAEKSKIGITKEGVFELQHAQIKQYISYIAIAEIYNSLLTTTIQTKHHTCFYSCYSLKIKNPNPNATISISQIDRRLFPTNSTYDYVPFRAILQKKNLIDGENHSAYVTAGFSFQSRNLDLAVNLTPGTYYLYTIGSWGQNHYDYNVTVFADQFVSITKINHANFPNLISEALTQQCVRKGKRSAKGSVDQYILYHQPSNLILITASSLVDKGFNHVLNMSQIKPQNIQLLNVIRPEDNFSKKQRHENKAYKQSTFQQKTWEVNLLPREKYTWVFSCNTDYDASNFKNWGFR